MKGAIIWQKQEAEANDIGDEYHYIMSCGAIKGDRRKLLPPIIQIHIVRLTSINPLKKFLKIHFTNQHI